MKVNTISLLLAFLQVLRAESKYLMGRIGPPGRSLPTPGPERLTSSCHFHSTGAFSSSSSSPSSSFHLSRLTAHVRSLTTGPVQDAAAVHGSRRSGFLPLHFPVERKQPAGHTQVSWATIYDCGTQSKWHPKSLSGDVECGDRVASTGQMWF